MRVNVHRHTANEADGGHSHLVRKCDCQARRSRDGSRDGNPRNGCFLHDLKAEAAADHQNRILCAPAVAQRGSQNLVYSVVTAEIFANAERVSLTVEKTCSMNAPG